MAKHTAESLAKKAILSAVNLTDEQLISFIGQYPTPVLEVAKKILVKEKLENSRVAIIINAILQDRENS